MSHVVLARKYRPRTFDEVVGQDLVVSILKASIEKNRVAHALLFTGGRGIGKTTIARLVAKALVCMARVGADPCGRCAQCVAIDNFSSLDVIEIDGASHTGVDDIRDLRDSARYQPASAKYKIFIIDEVHMLSTSAFNALLKILEEPPAHVMFIFATTEAHKIPKTILSRTQRYDFRRMSQETIFLALKSIMAREGFVVEDDGLRLISTLADGGMRDALSMLEQIINDDCTTYSAEMVSTTLGVVSHAAVKDISHALIDGTIDDALLIVKDIYEKGLDLCQLMDALAERFRILALCAHVDSKQAIALVPSIDERDIERARRHDKADLKRLFAMAIDGMTSVFQATKPLLALELFMLRAALRPPMSDALTINYCLQKLDAIMHNRPLPQEPFPRAKEVAPPKDTPQPQRIAPVTAEDIAPRFRALVAHLDKSNPAIASHLRHARPIFDDGTRELTLHFEQALHHDQVNAHYLRPAFQDALQTIFGEKLRVTLALKKAQQQPAVQAVKTVWEADEEQQKLEEQALYDRAAHNPLVKKALEIFGGDITSVKKVNPQA